MKTLPERAELLKQIYEAKPEYKKKAGNAYDKNKAPIEFFTLCDNGLTLPEISRYMQIPIEVLEAWGKDSRKKPEFVRAFKAGLIACEAWYVQTIKLMSLAQMPGPSIEGMKTILKTLSDKYITTGPKKEEEDPLKEMSDQQVAKLLSYKLNSPSLKPLIKKLVEEKKK